MPAFISGCPIFEPALVRDQGHLKSAARRNTVQSRDHRLIRQQYLFVDIADGVEPLLDIRHLDGPRLLEVDAGAKCAIARTGQHNP